MATLIVRNIDEALVRALKKRATTHSRSAEAEHREILNQALLRLKRRSFVEFLQSMPDVGKDSDFQRVNGETEPDVFN